VKRTHSRTAVDTSRDRPVLSTTLLGALATAGVLGVTHAIEPDHVTGISSLTSQYGDSRLSAVVGACFSVGHVALVVVWLTVGYVLLGATSFPPVFDPVGTIGVVVLLSVLGAMMAVGGINALLHAHEHEHGDRSHSHVHLHTPGLGSPDGPTHEHDHGLANSLKTGLVGALFTLSPPLSMIAFTSTLMPEYGAGVVALRSSPTPCPSRRR
jgi:ABC-type nickel/cobalt efflux system permease component RcnA